MEKVEVGLGNRTYDIFVGSGVYKKASEKIRELSSDGRECVCVADNAVLDSHCSKIGLSNFEKNKVLFIREKGGEGAKCFARLAELCDNFADFNLDRSGSIFALGGGVIGDLTGFAASCYMRGVDFYQIPTTLLAMVDSSVGGKTGINITAGKNLVGAFKQPKAVYADTDFLSSLPDREFAAGMAEVIKYGLLGDSSFFEELSKVKISSKSEELPKIIAKCCKMKAKVVAEDELETSSKNGRALLNLGHTFGHAIEKCAGYGTYIHGEGVALGMSMASRLSRNLGYLTDADINFIDYVIKLQGLPIKLSKNLKAEDMLKAMSLDKKASKGKKKFVILRKIGLAETTTDISDSEILSVLKNFPRD